MTDPRRIAVLDGPRRVDLVLPAGGTLGEVLGGLGLDLSDPDLALVTDGTTADPATPVGDVADGALITVVDLAQLPAVVRTRTAPTHPVTTWSAPWWAMVAVAVVAFVAGRGSALAPWLAGLLALGAVAATVVTAGRGPGDGPTRAVRLGGPAALLLAAVALVAPRTAQGATQLAVFGGGLAIGVLLVLALVSGPPVATRGALGVAAVVVLLVASVWGIVLWLGWSVQAAAAITAGLVPPALRALPSALLNLADGYFIDYGQFMRTRWAARGAVPTDPGRIDRGVIRDQVGAAVAGRLSGTVLLSVIGAVALPAATPGPGASTVVRAGWAALLVCYVLGTCLVPRSAGSRVLHWVPRASALVALAVAAGAAVDAVDPSWLVVVAAGALLVGLAATGAVVAAGRGVAWLVGSRVADVLEALAVALSLPVALVAAGAIETIRSMAG